MREDDSPPSSSRLGIMPLARASECNDRTNNNYMLFISSKQRLYQKVALGGQ